MCSLVSTECPQHSLRINIPNSIRRCLQWLGRHDQNKTRKQQGPGSVSTWPRPSRGPFGSLRQIDIFVNEYGLVWCRTAQWKPSAVWGPPFAQGIMTGECLTPQSSGMSHFMTARCSKSSALNLKKPHFFKPWLLSSMEVELDSMQDLNHLFFILQFGVHWHDDLANMYPDHCTMELPKGSLRNCLEPGVGTALRSET